MTNMIYLNNAATGYPKFKSTVLAMNESLFSGELSVNRDSVIADSAKERIFSLRNWIGEMMNAKEPHEIIFTASDTIALNMIIQGMEWKHGDVIIIDAMSHNAIARPAEALKEKYGVEVIPVKSAEQLEKVLKNKNNIKAGVFSHGSNVTGDVISAKKIGKILYKNKIPFILDVAQTIGLYPIDVEKFHVSAAAFAGHKGLNGPQGTGGFYIRKSFKIKPILFGGTGTESMSLNPEAVYPESFEVGTAPMHDLVGLHAAVKEIREKVGYKIYSQIPCKIAQYACDELRKLPQIKVYGCRNKQLPVISFNIKRYSCQEVGKYLGTKGIICRTGIHCAGMAINQLKCVKEYGGTVRVSFGYFNTKADVDVLIRALEALITRN